MAAKPATSKPRKAKPAFAKKNQAPTEAEFVARLSRPAGKRFESVRALLRRQKDVTEELYYYGPKTGWAWRYMRGPHSLCSIMIHDDRLIGIAALDASAQDAVTWKTLSPIAQQARKLAHGTPALLWLDLPLDGPGAGDFKTLMKAKLRTLPG
jgi:hypothetical protein